jgi:hypothetical protein
MNWTTKQATQTQAALLTELRVFDHTHSLSQDPSGIDEKNLRESEVVLR